MQRLSWSRSTTWQTRQVRNVPRVRGEQVKRRCPQCWRNRPLKEFLSRDGSRYVNWCLGCRDHYQYGYAPMCWRGKVLAPGHGFNSERSQRAENGVRP